MEVTINENFRMYKNQMKFDNSCKKTWPNTVFERVLADMTQCEHKNCKNKHAIDSSIILFVKCPYFLCYFSSWLNTVYFDSFSLITNSGYITKGINAKNQQFSDFSL